MLRVGGMDESNQSRQVCLEVSPPISILRLQALRARVMQDSAQPTTQRSGRRKLLVNYQASDDLPGIGTSNTSFGVVQHKTLVRNNSPGAGEYLRGRFALVA